jgi:hypothetical protein
VALRQRPDLNLALQVGPPVLIFFETPIFLPNKISCKGNKPTARRSERLSDIGTPGPPALSAMAAKV